METVLNAARVAAMEIHDTLARVVAVIHATLVVVVPMEKNGRPSDDDRKRDAMRFTEMKRDTFVPCASCGAMTAFAMNAPTVRDGDGVIHAVGATALDRVANDHGAFIIVNLATFDLARAGYLIATPSCAWCNGSKQGKEIMMDERERAQVARMKTLAANARLVTPSGIAIV